MDEKKGESCGSSGCCGCGKKFFIGLVFGLLIAAAAYGFFSAGKCMGKSGMICPVSGQMMQK